MDIYICYVYAYLREDDSPYYIGKGKDDRAYRKHKGISVPKDKSRIFFMETNLSDLGALALERRYIRWYGRKDNNTGILRNKTDGGEGCSGVIRTEEQNKAISDRLTGRKLSPEHSANIAAAKKGVKQSPEHVAKLIAAKKGVKLGTQSPEHKANIAAAKKGVKQSPEHVAKLVAIRTGVKKELYKNKGKPSGKKGIKRGPQSEQTKRIAQEKRDRNKQAKKKETI